MLCLIIVVRNYMCCENLGVTARLSVARSVPVLTAIVTVVSDSPASSIPFCNQCQRFFELIPSTFNFGCLLRSLTIALVGQK